MSDDASDDESASNPAKQGPDFTHRIDEDERPSEAVVRAVASATNTPVLDLDPLYTVTDPEHLDGLLDETRDAGLLESSAISIDFNGCAVTVTRDAVHVRESDDVSSSGTERFDR